MERLADRHPELELIVEERVTESVLEGLRQDTLDAGLVATAPNTPGVIGRTRFSEPFIAYVAPGHRLAGRGRLAASDLSLDDLWLLSEGHCLRARAVSLYRHRGRRGASSSPGDGGGCTRMAQFESGNLETLKGLVERRFGMTLLPALAAAGLATPAKRQLLIPFDEPVPSRAIQLVRRRQRHREPSRAWWRR
jgi:LysR family hydrogen peroxide-inducible transcriptional activator